MYWRDHLLEKRTSLIRSRGQLSQQECLELSGPVCLHILPQKRSVRVGADVHSSSHVQ